MVIANPLPPKPHAPRSLTQPRPPPPPYSLPRSSQCRRPRTVSRRWPCLHCSLPQPRTTPACPRPQSSSARSPSLLPPPWHPCLTRALPSARCQGELTPRRDLLPLRPPLAPLLHDNGTAFLSRTHTCWNLKTVTLCSCTSV